MFVNIYFELGVYNFILIDREGSIIYHKVLDSPSKEKLLDNIEMHIRHIELDIEVVKNSDVNSREKEV